MSSLKYTPKQHITEIHSRLSNTFREGRTLPLEYRRKQLLQVARLVQENADAVAASLKADLGRYPFEAKLGSIVSSALHAVENLEKWNSPEKPQVEAWRSGWDTTIFKAPKGTVVCIIPWNSPWVLTILPLIGAIAAGCTCLIKPSEHAQASAALMAKLIPQYLDPDAYAVCLGAWDHIFYTGSVSVGRIVAEAAAKQLTPVTLELGGQSPVFVDGDSTNIEIAAKRILWGKQQNAGQVCVAPNHVFVQEQHQSALVEAFKKAYDSFWPKGPLDSSSEMGRVVNARHYERNKSLLSRTKGKVAFGGQAGQDLRIEPAIVTGVTLDDPLMEEEIFGPILPIIPVANVDAAISHIRSGSTPLVIYVFTEDEETKNKCRDHFLNETFAQVAVYEIPFGGQGQSGLYGSYLGKYSFDTFIHQRGYINVPADAGTEGFMQGRYPPYSAPALEFFSQALKTKIPDA
ncbi:Aldehyde/histidinol dehydrogenase [Suillus subalutaceus]|uniref:Aldehyde/histidinol dehydrogenase n=1 Tax=Suillus subalutaceus TaxID=48586 RepID=UPI001B85CCFA|nr:Aldehyde/histidinol dehydrogenase [Suillus subalutaceus]KAG1850808.1 Aldehyde/histidinol dehydrogenase [Suillus subalutaceus]